MKKTMGYLALGLLLLTAPVWAADIDGKWIGSIDTPNGAMAIDYTFKAQGDALLGSSSGPDGAQIPIENGKITGSKLTFSLTVDFGAGPTKFDYTGELAGAELKLLTSFMDMPIELALKKAPG